MSIRLQSQVEPIPGYLLLERLGVGGFGEVWKAEAPGGLLKAIKFIHGNLENGGLDPDRIEQELKALNRVKTVRHPYILSLERIDIVNGQLVIVMELADRNLWHRFEECRAQGLPGIPRDELLRYMDEIAEALDLMATKFNLQHLDIKPRNLFLVYNHIKVADFGLVKDLQGMQAQLSSCVTPVYAAPETFDGIVSPFCDQYSLAVVYQELLTGHRPFDGASIHQLVLQHREAAPDLSTLPATDQPVMARALAKAPEQRHASCTAFVQALRQAPLAETPRPTAAPPGLFLNVDTPVASRSEPSLKVASSRPTFSDELPRPPTSTIRPMMTPAPRQVVTHVNRPAAQDLATGESQRPRWTEVKGNGLLFPALVIGVGQVGLKVLRQLRRSLNDRCGSPDNVPHIRLLYLDTDAEATKIAMHGDPSGCLSEREVLLARLKRPVHYLRPVHGRPMPESWLPQRMLYRIPRDQANAGGVRALGRLALIDNYAAITRRLHAEMDALTDLAVRTAAERATQLGPRTNRPRVYLAASLAGGTGSGMFLDLAYVIRHILRQRGFDDPEVVGLFLVPPVGKGGDDLTLGNAYAALTELHHYASPQAVFTGHFDDNDWPISDPDAPFTRCMILPEQSKQRSKDMATRVGDFLCRDLVTPLGRAADQGRQEAPGKSMAVRTFGMHWISWPRRALSQQIGRRLAFRLVESWLGKDRNAVRAAVHEWISEQWNQQHLSVEGLQGQLTAAIDEALGMTHEAAFDLGPAPLTEPAAVMQTLQRLEQLVGRPETMPLRPRASMLGDALHRAVERLSAAAAEKVFQLTVGLIDDPRFRLAGAEEALVQLTGAIEQLVNANEPRCKILARQVAEVHTRIHSLVFSLQKGSFWRGKRNKTLAELAEVLTVYPRLRLQFVLGHAVVAVYRKLQEGLAARQRETAFCRTRLGEFLRQLTGTTASQQQQLAEPAGGQYLLPPGCNTLADALKQITTDITPAELLELDQVVEGEVQAWLKSLVQVCMSASNHFDKLEALVCKQAEEFGACKLGAADLVEIYRKQRGGVGQVIADIANAFDEALPELSPASGSTPEIRILAAPVGEGGERFRYMTQQALPEVEWTAAASTDELVFYREQPLADLANLPQLGQSARAAYDRLCRIEHFTPHSRCDIYQWQAAEARD